MPFPFILAWALLALFVGAAPSYAYPTQEGRTLGEMAIGYRQSSNLWGQLDLGFVDAKTTTSPPDQAELDRRLESLVVLGGEGAFANKRWGTRLNVNAQLVKIRRAEEEPPRATTDATVQTITPSFDVTFVTDKGLEIFGGVQVRMQPAYEAERSFNELNSTETYGAYQLRSNRVGVTRRAGLWSGGFYYVLGADGTRSFEKTAIDGTQQSGDETVFIPPEIGVFGEFGKSIVWDMEFNFVQGRGNGPRDENGNTLYTDYFRARLGSLFHLGAMGLKVGAAHQTLAYSDSAFINLETIPWSSVEILAISGDNVSYGFFGVTVGYAKDGQSLPQFNADRQAVAGTISSGFFFPF